jgi:hypothetical protein
LHDAPQWRLFQGGRIQYVKMGAISVALANIVSFVSDLDDVRVLILKVFGIDGAEAFYILGAVLISATLVIGYALLAYWIFNRYFARQDFHYRLAFLGIAYVTAVLLLAANVAFAIPQVHDIERDINAVKQELVTTIMAQQERDGGFRFAQRDGSNDTQVWTTAQAMYALQLSGHITAPMDNAIDHIEKRRLRPTQGDPCNAVAETQEGWGYIDKLPWSVTEIISWVILAYTGSVEPAITVGSRTDQSRQEILIGRIERDLHILATRQHTSTGGWGPILRTENSKHIRTYSTILALWSMIEARRNTAVHATIGSKFDTNIRLGVNWLLMNWDKNLHGWSPNLPLKSTEVFPGLTAQTLYVLELIAKTDPFTYLQRDPIFNDARSHFVRLAVEGLRDQSEFRNLPIDRNQRLHDSDRYLEGQPYTAEQMTFLWYPWTVAVMNELQTDTALTDTDRKNAANVFRGLLRRIKEYADFARRDPVIYPSAEGLAAISFRLRIDK